MVMAWQPLPRLVMKRNSSARRVASGTAKNCSCSGFGACAQAAWAIFGEAEHAGAGGLPARHRHAALRKEQAGAASAPPRARRPRRG